MKVATNFFNIRRTGGYTVKYTDKTGIYPVKIRRGVITVNLPFSEVVTRKYYDPIGNRGVKGTHAKTYYTELVWMFLSGNRNVKPLNEREPGDVGFVYSDTKSKGYHIGGVGVPNTKFTRIPYTREEHTILANNEAKEKKESRTMDKGATYLGLPVKTLTSAIYSNMVSKKIKPEPFEYNDFGYKLIPKVVNTGYLGKKPEGMKTYNVYKPPQAINAESRTYNIKGASKGVTSSIPVVLGKTKEEMDKLYHEYTWMVMKMVNHINKYVTVQIGWLDYVKAYHKDWIGYIASFKNDMYMEEQDENEWWTTTEWKIDLEHNKKAETLLQEKATNQIIIPPETQNDTQVFDTDKVEKVHNPERFDIAKNVATEGAKGAALTQVLRSFVHDLDDYPELVGKFSGYKYIGKESQSNGHQARVYSNIDSILKWIDNRFFRVPKSFDLPITKLTVRGRTRNYVNLKDLGLTVNNEYVCTDKNQGMEHSDFKKLWTLYKLYLLNKPLNKLTKAEKAVFDMGKHATKANRKHIEKALKVKATSKIAIKQGKRPIGGMQETIPSNKEIAVAISKEEKLPTLLRLLYKTKLTSKRPWSFGQMYNMVHTGKRLTIGDRIPDIKKNGKTYVIPRPYEPVFKVPYFYPKINKPMNEMKGYMYMNFPDVQREPITLLPTPKYYKTEIIMININATGYSTPEERKDSWFRVKSTHRDSWFKEPKVWKPRPTIARMLRNLEAKLTWLQRRKLGVRASGFQDNSSKTLYKCEIALGQLIPVLHPDIHEEKPPRKSITKTKRFGRWRG